MKSFIKENAALVAALFLPVAFAAFFYVSKGMMNESVKPPQYDLVVMESRNNQHYVFEVIGDELITKFIYPTRNDKGYVPNIHSSKPKIYYIDSKSLSAQPINFALPDDAENPSPEKEGMAVSIVLEKSQGLSFSAASTAPDGYSFGRSDYIDGNILTEIYAGRRFDRRQWSLQKDSAVHAIDSLSGYNYQLLGWVVDSE